MKIFMFQPDIDEQIIAIVHRHWFVIGWKLSMLALLLVLTIPVLIASQALLNPEFAALALFLVSVYILIALLFGILFWINYYLDMWIITTKRVLDIEQISLFNRSVSELMLKNIQDVNVTISGFFATIFKYGNIIIQTAGEASTTIRDIPHPERIKDIIMKSHEAASSHTRS